ncbi:hypothetical protein CMI37_26750 [Candidatus Pacearchaeota archaeon]|nr:hypothetical protein [Candidatus Pacearchaeota archaeon]|tara:strand:+ start:2748 stop:3050 length:303 start_codon:yes stop_codon:yes gene_type:complete
MESKSNDYGALIRVARRAFDNLDYNNQLHLLQMIRDRALGAEGLESEGCDYCAHGQSNIPGIHCLCDELIDRGSEEIGKMISVLMRRGITNKTKLRELAA